MDSLGSLLFGGAVLEALVQIVKNLWDANTRSGWNKTSIVVVAVAVIVAIMTETNLVAATGLDFDVDILGQIWTGLLGARAANFVHDVYSKAS